MKSVLQDAAITSPVLFTMCVTVIKDDTNTNIYSHDFILYLFFDMIYDVRPIKPNDTSAPNNVADVSEPVPKIDKFLATAIYPLLIMSLYTNMYKFKANNNMQHIINQSKCSGSSNFSDIYFPKT